MKKTLKEIQNEISKALSGKPLTKMAVIDKLPNRYVLVESDYEFCVDITTGIKNKNEIGFTFSTFSEAYEKFTELKKTNEEVKNEINRRISLNLIRNDWKNGEQSILLMQ